MQPRRAGYSGRIDAQFRTGYVQSRTGGRAVPDTGTCSPGQGDVQSRTGGRAVRDGGTCSLGQAEPEGGRPGPTLPGPRDSSNCPSDRRSSRLQGRGVVAEGMPRGASASSLFDVRGAGRGLWRRRRGRRPAPCHAVTHCTQSCGGAGPADRVAP